MIRYFISFTHSDGRSFGSGNAELERSAPIASMDDVQSIVSVLREQGYPNPVVMAFSRFDSTGAAAGETR